MNAVRSIVVDSKLRCVSGLRIDMQVQGHGDPLLLINGMTRPLRSWGPFTEALPGRTLVSFDLPGVGGSPRSGRPLSIAELAVLAVEVLEAAGFEQADVLGFSHGGAVAQQLAFRGPDRVRGLILVSTSCGVGSTPSNGGRAILRGLGRSVDDNPWVLPDPLGLLWQSLAVSAWSSIPFLGAIQAPTLVVCGSRDTVVHPANSRVLAGRIPGATLSILPGAAHDLQRRGPATALARAVESFLSTLPATRRLQVVGLPA